VTYLIVGGLAVVVILLVVWLRFSASRSDRRSMETYGHALGVLGDVAKRTGPSPSVRLLPRSEPGRAHVQARADEAPPVAGAARPPAPDSRLTDTGRSHNSGAASRNRAGVSPARAHRRPSASMPLPEHEISVEDRGEEWPGGNRSALREPGERTAYRHHPRRVTSDAGERLEGPPQQSGEADAAADAQLPLPPLPLEEATGIGPPAVAVAPSRPVSPDELRREAAVRRLATGAFAILAVVAIVAAAVELVGGPTATSKSPKTTQPHSSVTTPTSSLAAPTTTTKPAVIKPISTSGNNVVFQAPPGDYVLRFSSSGGACYVGVETSLGSGDYLWSDTVQPGTPASYKAKGSFVVNVGAPTYLSVSMNGVPLRIPSDVTDDYLSFDTH